MNEEMGWGTRALSEEMGWGTRAFSSVHCEAMEQQEGPWMWCIPGYPAAYRDRLAGASGIKSSIASAHRCIMVSSIWSDSENGVCISGPDSQSKAGASVVFPALMRCSYKDERPAWAVQPARLQESGFHVRSSLICGAAHNGPK